MPAAKTETKTEEAASPEAGLGMTQDQLDNMIAQKVSEGVAAALPAVLAQIMASGQSGPVFAGGMGPSESVVMQTSSPKPAEKTYLKHYRKDDAVNGKHQFVDITKLVDGQFGDPDDKGNIPGVIKGRYVHFINGDFYATKDDEVAFVEWKMRTDPHSRIYEVQGLGVIPCGVVNCSMTFATEGDRLSHLAATHGMGTVNRGSASANPYA